MNDGNDAIILRDLVYNILFASVMHFNDDQREAYYKIIGETSIGRDSIQEQDIQGYNEIRRRAFEKNVEDVLGNFFKEQEKADKQWRKVLGLNDAP